MRIFHIGNAKYKISSVRGSVKGVAKYNFMKISQTLVLEMRNFYAVEVKVKIYEMVYTVMKYFTQEMQSIKF